MACCLAPPGPPGPLKASVRLSWPAGQAGIMGMTQPKLRLTSSTQCGGCSSGRARRSRSRLPPPPVPESQPGCGLTRLPEAPARDAGQAGPGLHHSGGTHFLPARWPPCPRRGRPSARGPAVQLPGRLGLGPGWVWGRAGPRRRGPDPGLGKVTPGQCSLYLASAPPLPRAWGCNCLGLRSLRLRFRFPCVSWGRGPSASIS